MAREISVNILMRPLHTAMVLICWGRGVEALAVGRVHVYDSFGFSSPANKTITCMVARIKARSTRRGSLLRSFVPRIILPVESHQTFFFFCFWSYDPPPVLHINSLLFRPRAAVSAKASACLQIARTKVFIHRTDLDQPL